MSKLTGAEIPVFMTDVVCIAMCSFLSRQEQQFMILYCSIAHPANSISAPVKITSASERKGMASPLKNS